MSLRALSLIGASCALAVVPALAQGYAEPCQYVGPATHEAELEMREQVTFGRSAGLHVLGPVRIDVPTDSVVLVSEPALCLRALRAYRRDAGVNDSVVTPKRIVLVRAGDGMFVVKAPDYATNILVYYDATFRKILATRDAD